MKSKQNLLFYVALLIFVTLSLVIVFGDSGLADLNLLRNGRDDLKKKNYGLAMENLSLCRAIERLKYDPIYVENIARQELGLVREGEIIYKISYLHNNSEE